MQRLNLAISDNLNEKLEQIVAEDEQTKNDILRKALTLYLVAHEERKKGNKVGTADPSGRLVTEFIGL